MSASRPNRKAGRTDLVGRGAAREGRGCPISKFSLYAVAISDPKACSVGLAVSPHMRREATPVREPSHAARVAAFLPDGWVTSAGTSLPRGCRRTFSSGQIARENLSLTLRHEPGSQALREVSNRLPCLVALHVQQHGASQWARSGTGSSDIGKVR